MLYDLWLAVVIFFLLSFTPYSFPPLERRGIYFLCPHAESPFVLLIVRLVSDLDYECRCSRPVETLLDCLRLFRQGLGDACHRLENMIVS